MIYYRHYNVTCRTVKLSNSEIVEPSNSETVIKNDNPSGSVVIGANYCVIQCISNGLLYYQTDTLSSVDCCTSFKHSLTAFSNAGIPVKPSAFGRYCYSCQLLRSY